MFQCELRVIRIPENHRKIYVHQKNVLILAKLDNTLFDNAFVF